MKNKNYLSFYECVVIDDEMWFSNITFNGLFKINLESYKTEFIAHFPDEKLRQRLLHAKCFEYKGQIVFVPARGSYVHIYNRDNGEFSKIRVFENEVNSDVVRYCNAAVRSGIFLYIVLKTGEMLGINLDTKEVSEIKAFKEQCQKYVSSYENFIFLNVITFNEKMMFALNLSNKILVWDITNMHLSMIEININNVSAMYEGKDVFWLTSNEDAYIYSCDKKTYNITKFESDIYERRYEGKFYNNVIEVANEVYAIPAQSEYIMKLNKQNKRFEKAFDYPHGFYFIDDFKTKWAKFRDCTVINNRLYLHPFTGNQMLIVESDTDIIGKDICVEDKDYKNIENAIYKQEQSGKIIFEKEEFNIVNFINVIKG